MSKNSTKQYCKSSATHCSAIQNSIIKLNLISAEIGLCKPVSVFSVLAGTEIFIFHHALNSRTSILHVNVMKKHVSKDTYLCFYKRLGSGSFRSYSRSVRSFRPDFRGESFRPNWGVSFWPSFKGGSFWPDLRGAPFRPELFRETGKILSSVHIDFALIKVTKIVFDSVKCS